MKRLIFLLTMILAIPAIAQVNNVTVTATITDPDGTAWTNGSWTAQYIFIASQGTPSQKGQFFTTSYSGTMNGSGVLSVTLASTVGINPATAPPTTGWQFTVCPATGFFRCFTTKPMLVAASGDFSAAISAAITVAPRINGTVLSVGYADVEVANQVGGSQYFRLTDNTFRCYTTSWGACGGGAGVASINSSTGAFTFSGSGVSCTGTTCTFSGTGTPASPNTYYQLNSSGSFGTATLFNASNTDQSTATNGILAPQFTSTGTLGQLVQTRIPNDGTTGTTANTLAIINSSGNAITATTSNTNVTVYPTVASWTAGGITSCAAGTTGNACLVLAGEASIIFDSGGGTQGHYVGVSTITGGDANDLGLSVGSGLTCVGLLLSSPAGGAQGTVALGNCPPVTSGITSVSGTSPITATGSSTVTVACPTCTVAPTVSTTAGDIACAVANDLTIAQKTITGGSSTASTITITGAVNFNAGYFVGEVINVQGVTPSGFNATGQVIASLSGTTSITYTNASNPGAWSSGGTVSKTCGNLVNDAIAATPYTFSNNFTIPANFMASGLLLDVQDSLLFYAPTANSPSITQWQLKYGSSVIYQNRSAMVMDTIAASALPEGGMLTWSIFGLGTASAITNPHSWTIPSSSTVNFMSNATAATQPAISLTTSASTLTQTLYFASTGIVSGTYTSGGSITGSATQTCNLATFNSACVGTTATVALTGTNTIAGGTALTITARGAACTAAATTATLSNGTATCSGTATLSTVLGGTPGAAVELVGFGVRKN